MVLRGRDIVRSLSLLIKNEKMFLKEVDLKIELEMSEFVLNPDNSKDNNWQDYLNDGISKLTPLGVERDRLMRKTIFLCDPVHWTMCIHILLQEKVNTMKHFLVGTKDTYEMGTTQKTSQITYTRDQVEEEIKRIEKLLLPLPKLKNLEDHIFISGCHFIPKSGEKKGSLDLGLSSLSSLVNELEMDRQNRSRKSLSQHLSSRLPPRQSFHLKKRQLTLW